MRAASNFLILVPSITYLEADTNYTIAYFEDGTKKLFARTLKRFEEDFENSKSFLRIHRSYLVNNQFIMTTSKSAVQLKCGKTLPIARRRRMD